MYPVYRDLRQRLGPPLWHDWHGVPRYDPYTPGQQNIYAVYEVLLDLQCAACHQWFAVASCAPRVRVQWPAGTVVTVVEPTWWAWGDAPWHIHPDGHGLCEGATMVANILAVREYWRHEDFTWQRHAEWEGPTPMEA